MTTVQYEQEKNTFAKYEWVFHASFWLLFYIYLVWDAYFDGTFLVNLGDSLFYLLITAAIVYANVYVLVPRFLFATKYLFYALLMLALIFAGAAIKQSVYTWLIPAPDNDDYPPVYIFFTWTFKTLFEVTAISSLKIIQNWFSIKNRLQSAENKRLEAELKFLKAQMNPHFLFNTLNNIYFLIEKDKSAAADAVHKLSGLLRFRLYETERGKIEIEHELEYIRTYIELEKLRSAERLEVKLEVNGTCVGKRTEPFIFLDFIENAFKHNMADNMNKGFIHIRFTFGTSDIAFEIENSVNMKQTQQNPSGTGIGLSNIEKRLQLSYPSKHRLSVQRKEDLYVVRLQLEL